MQCNVDEETFKPLAYKVARNTKCKLCLNSCESELCKRDWCLSFGFCLKADKLRPQLNLDLFNKSDTSNIFQYIFLKKNMVNVLFIMFKSCFIMMMVVETWTNLG